MLQSTSPVHLIVLIAVLLLLVGVVWAIAVTLTDRSATTTDKVAWIALLLLLPVIGLLVWLLGFLARRRHAGQLGT